MRRRCLCLCLLPHWLLYVPIFTYLFFLNLHRSNKNAARCTEDSLDIKASSTFCLLNLLTYYQSQYRHLHAPGRRRHSVNGRSSVYSNCAGSNCAGSTSPEYLMTKMLPCPDWRCVLSGVWRWIFGKRIWRARYCHTEGGCDGLETWAKATLIFTIFHQKCVVKLALLMEVRLPVRVRG